jgi:hypothetical protein
MLALKEARVLIRVPVSLPSSRALFVGAWLVRPAVLFLLGRIAIVM